MSLKNVNTVLATAGTLFVLYLGLSFILTPETSTPGVGLPNWPAGSPPDLSTPRGDGPATWPGHPANPRA